MTRTKAGDRPKSGPDLLKQAEKENPGVAEILRFYLRAMKAVDEDLSVPYEESSDAAYYTSDSTAVC